MDQCQLYKYKSFISYNQKDSGFVISFEKELIRAFKRHNYSGNIFRDRHSLSAGGDIWIDLKHALENSEWLMVVCSQNINNEVGVRNYVDEECNYFANILQRKDKIICVISSGSPAIRDVKIFYPKSIADLSQKLAIDARREEEWNICISKAVSSLYCIDFDQFYKIDQQILIAEEYSKRIVDSIYRIENGDNKQALSCLSYEFKPQYDNRGLEYNYLISLATGYSFPDFLGILDISENASNFVLDIEDKLLFFSQKNELNVFNIAENKIFLTKTAASEKKIVKILFGMKNKIIITLGEDDICTVWSFHDNDLTLLSEAEIQKSFFDETQKVFESFMMYAKPQNAVACLFDNESKIAISSGASITIFEIYHNMRSAIIKIPNIFYNKIPMWSWKYIMTHNDRLLSIHNNMNIYIFSLNDERILLFYNKKDGFEKISSDEKLYKNIFVKNSNYQLNPLKENGIQIKNGDDITEIDTINIDDIEYAEKIDYLELSYVIFYLSNKSLFIYFINNSDLKNIYVHIPFMKDIDNNIYTLSDLFFIEKRNDISLREKNSNDINSHINELNVSFDRTGNSFLLYSKNMVSIYNESYKVSKKILTDVKGDILDRMIYDIDVENKLFIVATDGNKMISIRDFNNNVVSDIQITKPEKEESDMIKKYINRKKNPDYFTVTSLKNLKNKKILIGTSKGRFFLIDQNASYSFMEIFNYSMEIKIIDVSGCEEKLIASDLDSKVLMLRINNYSVTDSCEINIDRETSFCTSTDMDDIFFLTNSGDIVTFKFGVSFESHRQSTGYTYGYSLIVDKTTKIALFVTKSERKDKASKIVWWSIQEKKEIFSEHFIDEIKRIILSRENDCLIIIYMFNLDIRYIYKDITTINDGIKSELILRRKKSLYRDM